MSDDIEALPDVWLHNLPHLQSNPPLYTHTYIHTHVPAAFSDGFVGPPQKAPLNDRTFIIILFSNHSALSFTARVVFFFFFGGIV